MFWCEKNIQIDDNDVTKGYIRPCRSGMSERDCDLCIVRETKKNLLAYACES